MDKDNLGKFHQDLPLLHLFEGLKMWYFCIKTFDNGIKNKNYTKVWMPPFILLLLNIYPKVYLGKKLPPIAELLRWETGVVFQETAVFGQ